MALLFTDWHKLPFLILSSIPVLSLPGSLLVLPFTLPSITRGSRSPWHSVCPSQAFCLFLMVDIIDFSSSTCQSTSSLLSLSDQKTIRIFLQSHILLLSWAWSCCCGDQCHHFQIASFSPSTPGKQHFHTVPFSNRSTLESVFRLTRFYWSFLNVVVWMIAVSGTKCNTVFVWKRCSNDGVIFYKAHVYILSVV